MEKTEEKRTERRSRRREKGGEENGRFSNIIPLEGDITSRDALLSIVVRTRHGYIDLLVNNAAIATNLYPHPLPAPLPSPDTTPPSIKPFQNALWDCGSPQDFADTFSTNVTAIYYTTIAFLDSSTKATRVVKKSRAHSAEPGGRASTTIPDVASPHGLILGRIPNRRQSPVTIVHPLESGVHAREPASAVGDPEQRACAGRVSDWCVLRLHVSRQGGTYNAFAAAEVTMALPLE
ncbi:hypothetical protein D9611_007380 [Ephemerocybe angulata]|uniref:Uncharacterized protein n=1 Tax=Ephemerocybe angulata TaxID=980116 RepID=A0A8H5FKK8_9AGAR|nr:hypothetical protein D9611_007380 [Tulosesus angulatus]